MTHALLDEVASVVVEKENGYTLPHPVFFFVDPIPRSA